MPAFSTDFLSVAPLLTCLTTLADAPLFAYLDKFLVAHLQIPRPP